jgi:hypothetical protein
MNKTYLTDQNAKWFEKQLNSLPADEQPSFREGRHPCQEKSFTGYVVTSAEALRCQIGHDPDVKRVAVAGDKDGPQLEVILKNDSRLVAFKTSRPIFRGYKVYWRVEHDKPAA